VTGYWGISLYDDMVVPSGRATFLNNDGLIHGSGIGVELASSDTIIANTGTISGFYGIENLFYSGEVPDQKLVLTNTGLIKGTGWQAPYNGPLAILGAYGSNVMTNKGHIEGAVVLGTLGDIYDGRGGTVTGDIRLMDGDDVAFGGNGSEIFLSGKGKNYIDGGAGADAISFRKSSAATVDLRLTAEQRTGSDSWDTIRNIENLIGSIEADDFTGNGMTNALDGAAGADKLFGIGGDDLLTGGVGNDILNGGEDSDTAVFSGKFSDYTITKGADGSFMITDNRASGDGVDQVIGVEFALSSDRVFTLSYDPPSKETPATPVRMPIPPVNLKLVGSKRADTFIGGDGDDYLNGGLGRDRLTGGQGKDVFVFRTKLKNNVDTITDFQDGQDVIQLSKGIFSKISKGALKKSAFHIGMKAKDASDRIILNAKTGALFYDADGKGKKFTAVKFAQLETKTLLSADDFWVL
jgi:Ca2+-binding RTX toxin-like protein